MITHPTLARLSLGLLVVASVLLTLMPPVSAHTGFESSSPGDGDVVEEPITEITLTFSGEATPAGDGFVVLDPRGAIRIPDEISSADNLTWILRFDDPLVDGVVGVRWSVAAPDTHPIEGSFSFTSTAPLPTTAPPTTTPPATALPTTTPPTTASPTTSAAVTEIEPEEAVTIENDSPTTQLATEAIDLDDFLNTSPDKATGASLLATASRILGLVGAVGAIGGTIFAGFVLRGDPRDIRAVLLWVRRAGVIITIGAIIQLAAQLATSAQSWTGIWSSSTISDVVWSSLGAAIALRVVGGVMIVLGARPNTHEALPTQPHLEASDEAWRISERPAAFVGLSLVALSFLLDGHTVSEGPRWLHALANLIHVTSAATWAGGVLMLALVLARRHRRGADTRALQLGLRFSVVATVALVAAAIAGTAMTIVILDSLSEIWTTSWGRLLVLKVVLVVGAAIGGGYNHRVLIPSLERAPNDTALAHRFRTIVTIEAAALIGVTVVTAFLIAASAT